MGDVNTDATTTMGAIPVSVHRINTWIAMDKPAFVSNASMKLYKSNLCKVVQYCDIVKLKKYAATILLHV